MGFTTGLVGGFTLTSAIVYFSLELHTRNRVHQASLLRQQALILQNTVNPQPAQPPPVSREVRGGLWDTAKDRWNAELENNVRKLQTTDWNAVRYRLEENVSSVWRRAFEKGEEVASDQSK